MSKNKIMKTINYHFETGIDAYHDHIFISYIDEENKIRLIKYFSVKSWFLEWRINKAKHKMVVMGVLIVRGAIKND